MKVSELAAELEVPTSTILDQCQRFGIDATWAGAELSGTDLVVLRAELATADAIDLTPADAAGPAEPAAAPADDASAPVEPLVPPPPSAVPPTAVGSMPGLIEEMAPAAEPGAAPGNIPPPPAPGRAPGFSMAGDQVTIDDQGQRRVPPRPAPAKRRLERGARNAVVALAVGVAAFAGSNVTEVPALVVLLWLIAGICLCVAVVDGIRGRRRVQTHPERVHGLWLATIAVVLAVAGLIGMTASVVGAVGDSPADEAPLGVGSLQSVQVARWGYQRVGRYADNGWTQPARDVHSCWEPDPKEERDEQRVEEPGMADLTKCDRPHTLEVATVFAYNQDADAPYPSEAEFVEAAGKQCGALYDKVTEDGEQVRLSIEYPTEVGWSDGDHDVACVFITDSRKTSLLDD